MESVAEPAPALASTTSVPAFWMRSVIFAASSSVNSTFGVVCAPPRAGSGQHSQGRKQHACQNLYVVHLAQLSIIARCKGASRGMQRSDTPVQPQRCSAGPHVPCLPHPWTAPEAEVGGRLVKPA